jgi:class 3 adenylate cyclase
VVRSQLNRFRGREVNTSGDGFLAMLDGPKRAIRCAMAICDAVQALGIEVCAGLHTGECVSALARQMARVRGGLRVASVRRAAGRRRGPALA